eukprot:2142435-Pleurochrysis_carterae.AAC.1
MFAYRGTVWMRMLQKVQNFIQEQGGARRPSRRSKNADERRLAQWVHNQEWNYAHNVNIMKDVAIREKWTEF